MTGSPLLRPGSPFEIVETEDGPGFAQGPHTLNEVYRRARRMGDKVMVVHDGAHLTYGSGFARAAALARRLERDEGVAAGDTVVLALPNGGDWAVWFIALTALGATVAAVEPETGSAAYAAKVSGASLVIDARTAEALASGLEFVEQDAMVFERITAPATGAVIAFTSGSTGRPKGVLHTQLSLLTGLRNGMLGAALLAAARHKPTMQVRPAPPCTMLLAPLPYIAGFSALVLSMMTFGRLVVPSAHTDDRSIAELIQAEAVRALVGPSPALLSRLFALPAAAEKLASLTSLQLHGSAIAGGVARDALELLPLLKISVGYGLTETAGALAVADFEALQTRPGAAGRALPSVGMRIVRADGADVGPGETGAILVRGAMLMRGYLTADGLAKADDWFDTGDLGHLDEEGYLYVERERPSITLGATPISPRGVEDLALDHPFVADAIVCTWSTSTGTQRVALVVERRSHTASDLEALRAHVAGRYGFTDGFSVVEWARLPRRASGKVDGLAVRQLLVSGQA